MAAFSGTGAAKPQAADLGDIHWTLPANWTQVAVPETGEFHPDAEFQIDSNDPQLVLSISHLGDAPGARSVLGNVVRWEGQEGLPKSTEANLASVTSATQVDNQPATLVDLNGNGRRLLAVMIPHNDRTWFIKLPGSAEAVSAHKEHFEQFVHSIHFDASEQPATVAQGPTPPPSIAPTAPAGVTWQVPSGWVTEPATTMLLAKFQAAAATVKVSQFGVHNFGSLEANLTRWRGEAGLAPLAPSEVKDVAETEIGGRPWKIYDFAGPAARVIVAQTQQGNDVYFFKISGPADVVSQQKPAFDQFVASVKFAQ